MKKHLLIAGIAVLSTSAYATTARLQALGQDTTRGSFFIDDNYNVFRNAAYVNMYKNYTVTEWGTENSNQATANTTQQLEGGFFREMGNFAYGVYFNNESDTAEQISQAQAIEGITLVDHEFKTATNGIDLFFGGDMGVQWGARIHYASSSEKVTEAEANDVGNAYEAEHSAMNISLGMMMGDLGAYANVGIKNEYTGALDGAGVGVGDANADEDKLEGSGSLNLGVNYKMGATRFFVDYASGGMEYTDGTDTSFKKEYEKTEITVGAGHTHEVSSTARVYSSLSYVKTDIEGKTAANTTLEKGTTSLPLLIGFEADANSWLTLRGHITQNLPFLSKEEFTNSNAANQADEDKGDASTAFAAGATLNFGKLTLDGVISSTRNIGGQAAQNDDLRTDLLMSKVAVIYNF